ncbi:hypothetical protein PsorP6_006883 [Peronosclerospora sorghi]|uniref:Uncharacterized protein n=1 Tax=Peronosclerospora sorghi TaxID=230839 RepID=A0ACC0W8S7_9STRA|nr:hypothetical protein PsorP6_006883 [Peronosclerospora sorghi]
MERRDAGTDTDEQIVSFLLTHDTNVFTLLKTRQKKKRTFQSLSRMPLIDRKLVNQDHRTLFRSTSASSLGANHICLLIVFRYCPLNMFTHQVAVQMITGLLHVGIRKAATLTPRFGAYQHHCSLWIKVQDDQDPVRLLGRMQMIMAEDGTLKTMALKRVHEKKWEKRKRKREEQNIRRANRRVGSLIDFILRRKKACVHGDAGSICMNECN